MPSAGHFARLKFIIALYLTIQPTKSTLTSSCTQSCQEQCIDRNIAFPLNAYEFTWPNSTLSSCDFQCHVTSCRQGCTDLDETSTCDTKCSDAGNPDSCTQGCRAISDNFLNQIQILLNQVTIDADLDETQGIQLNWTFDHVHDLTIKEVSAANLKWFAQSRSAVSGWRWTSMGAQAFRDSKLSATVYVSVGDLLSDVWFRLAAVWRDTVITSQSFHQNFPSLPVKPNPPTLGGSIQVTNNSWAVCWHTNRSPDKLKPKFRLVLNSKTDGEALRALEISSTCHIFRNLPSNCCSLVIEDISNEEGSEPYPSLRFSFELKPKRAKEEEKPFLIFTNGSILMRANDLDDYAMTTDPTQLAFMLPDERNITALSSLSSSELLVGLSDGSIHLLDLKGDNGTTIQKELRPEDNEHPILQIEVDHLQESLYFIRGTKGISRCWIRDCRNETKLETGSLQFIQNIAVDSWNGNIYYSTNNGDTSSTPLFPITATDVYTLSITRRLAELPPVQTLQVDESEQRLIAILRNGSMFSVDLIDKNVRDEREGVELSDSGYHDVKRSFMYSNRLFWISTACNKEESKDEDDKKKTDAGEEGCLRSEEVDEATQKVHLNTYIGGFGTSFRDFVVMHDVQRPAAVLPVDKIGLLISNSKGRVTWRPPYHMPYQASSNWRLLRYQCRVEELSATDDAKEVVWKKNLNTTELTFPAKPSRSYKASVRVCFRDGTCSDWSNTTNTAISNDQLDHLVVYVKAPTDQGLPSVKLNVLGEEFKDERELNLPSYFSTYLQGNDQLEPQALMDFDAQNQLIYLTAARNGSIYRLEPDGSHLKLVDFLSIKHMTLMVNQAIMFVASSYQIAVYRLTSSFHGVIYNCVESDCASVVGLAADSQSRTLFYLLKNTNGTVELHSLKMGSDRKPQLLAIADKFPSIRQMIALGESLLVFLTEDGHVGSCDSRLSNLNLNNAITDAQFLIQLSPSNNSEDQTRSKFENGIEFQTAKFSWSMSPNLTTGQALYKIQLFQDNPAGERTVDITLGKEYTLPAAVLKKWCSKQKFDVQIDAITPWTITVERKGSLFAPQKPPNPPTNLKIYATQQRTVDGARAMIDLFWEDPTEWNGEMSGFVVQCNATGGEEAKTVMIVNANLTAHRSRAFFFSTTSGRVSCAVASKNEQQLVGPFSDPVSIDSSEFRPLVRLFFIDSNSNLLAIYNWSTITPVPSTKDAIKQRHSKRQTDLVQYQSVAYISNELYAVRKEADSIQPQLVLLDINDVSNILHKVAINGDIQQISAMTSDWIANRLLFVGDHDLMQITLENLQSQSSVTPKALLSLSIGAQDAKQLTFDPFTNTAYLLSKNGSLFSLNLNKKQEDNLGLHLDCLKSQTVTAIVNKFIWNKPVSPILYALTWNGMITVTVDPLLMKCSEVNVNWTQFRDEDSSQSMKLTPEAQGLKSVTSFSVVDKFFVFATFSKMHVHDDKLTSPIAQIPILNPPLKQLLATSHSSQPYPERQCFALPSPTNINFTVKNEDRTGAVIEVLNEAIITPSTCPNISFPQTQYQIYFRRKDSEKTKTQQSVQRITYIENGILDKETDYDVYLSWFNRYYTPSEVSDIKHLRTGYGFPTAPLDPKAFALAPDTVILYWKLPQTLNAPAAEIKYKIKQSNQNQLQPVAIGAKQFINGNFSQDFSDSVSCLQNTCQAKISNLRPATEYKFWVSAIHIQRINLLDDSTATSTETTVRTKDIPGTLRMESTTSDSIVLRFTSLEPEIAPREVCVRYRETILNHQAAVETAWIQAPNSTFDPLANPQVNLTINDLRSATSYDYQFVAYYGGTYQYDKENKTFTENYYQGIQQARTKAGAPSQPEDVRLVSDVEGWYLRWKKPADSGGLPLTSYAIDFRKNSTSDWTISELGLPADQQLRWRIDKKLVEDPKQVEFRVRAYNAEGFGAYGYTETEHEKDVINTGYDFLVWSLVGIIPFLLLIMLACIVLFIAAKSRQYKEKMRKLEIHKQINLEELSEIQSYESIELPLEIRNEIRNLPKIPLCHLVIEKEIGSGSFGSVSRGVIQGWKPLGKKSVTVAIKQVRGRQKGQERAYFLKEAVIMNNFDHPNVIRLLGVCLDDPYNHMLVMEYMDGGDLHSFLRSCRNSNSPRPAPSIRMRDLISMMVDVGRAMTYLEANRHVHRDLAARNCLISSKMSSNRITKISDFGLAREIHHREYYRLKTEDLLPLRWLSPEAAHEGLFTSKSDVWAFGVLIFEILTLGERPYRAFENSDVLARLLNGHNPGKPHGCPNEIHDILQQTWIVDAKQRVSFNQILPQLEKLRGRPELQTIDSLPKREVTNYENNVFDNSTDSSRSENIHFNKSDTRSRGHQMPQSMRRRQSNPNQMLDSDSYRADSNASAETFVTSIGEYETPRPVTTTATNSIGYLPTPKYSDASNFGQRSFFYNNDGFQHELDANGGEMLEENAYEMLNQSVPPLYHRHRPPPLSNNITSAPSLQPLGTPSALQNNSYPSDSPTRRTSKLVSRV